MTYIDLTQTFTADMPTFPGDPKSELTKFATIEKDGFTDYTLKTSMHIGTHMDAPMHMIAGGKKISELLVEKFFGRGVLIDARGQEEVGAELLAKASIQPGDIILVLTGQISKHPELSEEFAWELVRLRVNIVGMDMDGPDSSPFKIHKILLENGILILENLINLDQLLNQKFEVSALPMKLETDAAMARVVAKII
jgi:kynurenine formamidase